MQNQIKIGTHIIIKNKKGEVLLCKRNKKFGFGEWELPGGHVEFQESFEQNLERECKEELGISVKIGKLVSVATNMKYGNHYIIFTFLSKSYTGKAERKEPHEHAEINWFTINKLPKNLFISTEYAIRDYVSGNVYELKRF
jgi:8-oxo-dGTP diphosphatase